jgi:hypothetical protein
MVWLSEPVPTESHQEDKQVHPSIITVQEKEEGAALWKCEMRHCICGGSKEQGKDFYFSCSL